MKRVSRLSLAVIALVGIGLSGCQIVASPLAGGIFNETKYGDVATDASAATKEGKACGTSILGLVATGDASVQAAKDRLSKHVADGSALTPTLLYNLCDRSYRLVQRSDPGWLEALLESANVYQHQRRAIALASTDDELLKLVRSLNQDVPESFRPN